MIVLFRNVFFFLSKYMLSVSKYAHICLRNTLKAVKFSSVCTMFETFFEISNSSQRIYIFHIFILVNIYFQYYIILFIICLLFEHFIYATCTYVYTDCLQSPT